MFSQQFSEFIGERTNSAYLDRIKDCPQYNKLRIEHNQLWDKIKGTLTAEQRDLLNQMESNRNLEYCIMEQEVYLQGLRDGLKLFDSLDKGLTLEQLQFIETEKECATVGASSAL